MTPFDQETKTASPARSAEDLAHGIQSVGVRGIVDWMCRDGVRDGGPDSAGKGFHPPSETPEDAGFKNTARATVCVAGPDRSKPCGGDQKG